LLVALDALTCCHNNAATGNEKDGRVEIGGFGIFTGGHKYYRKQATVIQDSALIFVMAANQTAVSNHGYSPSNQAE
jgi:hypothetical protein